MTIKPLKEQESLGREGVYDVISGNQRISNCMTSLCDDFFAYLKTTGKDIKVWQNVHGKCLLICNDKAVRCDIDVMSSEPLSELDEFYIEMLKFYGKYQDTHPNFRYIPQHTID